MFIRFLIVFVLIVLVELYFFQIIKTISIDYSPGKRKALYYAAYALAGINILLGAVSLISPPPEWNAFFRFISSVFFILLICKIFGILFLAIDDIIRLFRWIGTYFQKAPADATEVTHHISRLKFLSYVGLTFTIVPAISFLYGMVKGAYKYRVHKVKVKSPNLPEAFNGFKIVQLSDIHSGSFLSAEPLVTAFNMVLEQKPDMILFTGDLVNNEATEAEPHMESYKMLKAPYGVYSSLGNHDYGDYKKWESKEAKAKNLDDLKEVHAKSGWRLLMNEHVPIEKDGQKIALLGIENWGGNLNFPRYGKLENAHAGTEHYPFKILLSHDPSHWDMQVSQERRYKDIDLTLSGHTHGMQFGIEIPGFKWSPVKYIYKHWAGLYRQDNQYLYVNRGLGFLGYPGRLGIWPEITVIELERG
jgi:predicted MPP superfamily phosphohydrolase